MNITSRRAPLMLLALLAFELLGLPAASAAPQHPDEGLPQPRPSYLPLADAVVTPQQAGQSVGCTTATINGSLDDDGYRWNTFLLDTVLLSNDVYYSPPLAAHLLESSDTSVDTRTGLDDAFGQVFRVPSDTERIEISYNIYYDASTINVTDTVYLRLYRYDPLGVDGDILGELAYSGYIDDLSITASDWYAFVNTFDDQSGLAAVQGSELVAVVGTATDGEAPFLDTYVDDVEVKVCSLLPPDGGIISGTVSESGGGNLRNAELLLTYLDPQGTLSTINTTVPDASGSYTFTNVPPLSAGAYQVWFVNNNDDANRLDRWAGPLISSFAQGQKLTVPPFDVGAIMLGTPTDLSEQTFPVTFSWQRRQGGASEQYQLCLSDLANDADICYRPTSETSRQVTLEDVQQNFGNDFRFDYGKPYAWYVQVVGPTYRFDSPLFADAGIGGASREVTFVAEQRPPPNQNTTVDVPPAPVSKAAWTVMVYLAGDNDLSSPAYSGNLQEQYASLKRLAPSYRGSINVIVLADFDLNGDTRLCNLSAETACPEPDPDDREKDTANPLVLTNFISGTVSAYAADHYMLIVSSHGQMVSGTAFDETSPGQPNMTPSQLRGAISDGLAPSGKKLDVLFLYACLMGGIEAAVDASANAGYLVASSDQVWVVDFYDELLHVIKANATQPAAVAKGIVNAYQATLAREGPGLFASIAAYDLARAEPVRLALSGLADALRNDGTAADGARGQVQRYDSSGDDELTAADSFVDLTHLARLLSERPDAAAATKAAALALRRALGETVGASIQAESPLVIASQQVSGRACLVQRDLSNASGLLVYFPSKSGYDPGEFNQYRRAYQAFGANNSWDDFVASYVDQSPARAPVSKKRANLPVASGCSNAWLPLLLRR